MTNPSVPDPLSWHSRSHIALVCVALILLTFLAFFGVWNNEFIDYDDNTYVFLNPDISRGFDWHTVVWSFNSTYGCNWHPLTWLSHGMDCQFYGLKPAGHHITSLIFHATNVVLLFFLLRLMTGSFWRSALVAALFGVHPLRVESVAWIAERKDVLSGLFFMVTLIAYTKYVRVKTSQSTCASSRAISNFYWLTVVCFALGLMSKPMLVTMPFVLMLLDYWPFQRYDLLDAQKRWESIMRLAREKTPFFILTVVSSLITVQAQDYAVMSVDAMPLQQRLGNAVQAYVAYIQQIFWPRDLAVFYPKPALMIKIGVFGSLAILAIITVISVRNAKKLPGVLVCWFFYLGVLVPVIGIVQVGSQAHADRYTYLPSIGVSVLVVWAAAALVAKRRLLKPLAMGIACVVIFMLCVATQRQVGVWRNTESLFAHAAKVTSNNYVALTTLAKIDLSNDRVSQAESKVKDVLKFAPGFPWAEYLMATVLQMQGKMQEAIPHLERSVGVDSFVPSRARMVLSLLDAGRLAEADAALSELMSIMPRDGNLAVMKAAILNEAGQMDEAGKLFNVVIQSYAPPLADNPTLNYEIAELYSLVGKPDKAQAFYRKALDQFPDHLRSLNNFAWMLATSPASEARNGSLAVQHATRACELTSWNQPVFMGTLAAALAEVGRFEDAVKMAERARDKARAQGAEAIANRNAELLEIYKQGNPFRETSN